MSDIICETDKGILVHLNNKGEKALLSDGSSLQLKLAGAEVDIKASNRGLVCISRFPEAAQDYTYLFSKCKNNNHYRLKDKSLSSSQLGNLETLLYDLRLEVTGKL